MHFKTTEGNLTYGNKCFYPYIIYPLNRLCWCFLCSCLTNGTHMEVPKQPCLVQSCLLEHHSQTSHNTALLYLTQLRASISTSLTHMTFMKSQGLSMKAGVSVEHWRWSIMLHLIWEKKKRFFVCICVPGPEYEEVEVHLLREKTGFGFRILGGDEAVQAVSPDARDKARMGRAGPHTYLTSYTPTPSYLHLTSPTLFTLLQCIHITNMSSIYTLTHKHTITFSDCPDPLTAQCLPY